MTQKPVRTRFSPPIRNSQRREDYILDPSTLNPSTAAVVKVIDLAIKRRDDTTPEVELLRQGVATASKSRRNGELDSWAIAAALVERDVVNGYVPNVESTFNYVQHMLRSEIPSVVGPVSRGVYQFQRGHQAGTSTPARAAQVRATPRRTVRGPKTRSTNSDADLLESAAHAYRTRKAVSVFESKLGRPADFAPAVAGAGTNISVPDMQGAAEKTREAAGRHQRVVAAISAGGLITGAEVKANQRVDGAAKAASPEGKDTWFLFEAKSTTRESFVDRIALGVAQLHRQRTDYDFGTNPLLAYLAIDRITGVCPVDLAWAVKYTEANGVHLVRLVEDTTTGSFHFAHVELAK